MPSPSSRWLHFLAVGTVCAALPLLFLGAEVTTKGVGMVDPRGFRWPWEIIGLLSDPDNRANSALVLELAHRMFAFLVGILAIALCIGFLVAGQGWRRGLGAVALAAVVAQGLLGRYRVDLNALVGPSLAMIHGVFAQFVVAILASVALMTSTSWARPVPSPPIALRRWIVSLVIVVFLQLILGGMMRHHLHFGLARFHLLGAFLVFAGLLAMCQGLWREGAEYRPWVKLILGLLFVQILLGVEAWFSWSKNTFDPTSGIRESATLHWIRSGHYLIGALIFATTVVITLKTHRGLALAVPAIDVPRSLEGAL